MSNNGDGTLTFAIPDHPEAPEMTVSPASFTSGREIKREVMAWARGYGVTDAGF